jgi:hypothetical protein
LLWLDLRHFRSSAAAARAQQIGLPGHDRLGECAAAADAEQNDDLKKQPQHHSQDNTGEQ